MNNQTKEEKMNDVTSYTPDSQALVVGDESALAPASAVERTDANRAIAELKAQVFLARQFPRDTVKALNNIIQACQRPYLAEKAMYSYPRGGQTVSGPSIRLAEAMAQAWGNLQPEVKILERNMVEHYSEVLVSAWDVESNTRWSRTLRVSHFRDTKKGRILLKEDRDISEMEQNMAARSLRGCILRAIPVDIQESAIEQVKKTLAGDTSIPVVDRIRRSLPEFSNLGVSPEMLEAYFGVKLDRLTNADFVELKGIYSAIKDGEKKVSDYFGKVADEGDPEATDALFHAVNNQKKDK